MKISTNNMPMFELNHLIEINPYLSAQVIFNAHAFGHNIDHQEFYREAFIVCIECIIPRKVWPVDYPKMKYKNQKQKGQYKFSY